MLSGEVDENSDVYTPLRNLVLLGMTLAYAEDIGADIVVTGSKGHSKIPEKTHSYYDSTLAFHTLIELVWSYISEKKRVVRVIPILAEGRENTLTKKQVYSLLKLHGIGERKTWSCFRGGDEECGECTNCLEKKAFYNVENKNESRNER